MHRMTKFFIATILFTTMLQFTTAQSFAGHGRWSVWNIAKCPYNSEYIFEFDLERHKYNRTHDSFFGWFKIDQDLDGDYGVKMDVCKHVDGGCKPYYILSDKSFCSFVERYCKDNMEDVFETAGISLPLCPLKKGKYEIPNYVFNYGELPDEGMTGVYDVKTFILYNGREVACVDLTVEFTSSQDESDEEKEA